MLIGMQCRTGRKNLLIRPLGAVLGAKLTMDRSILPAGFSTAFSKVNDG